MENLRDQDFKAKITKTWNKGIYDRDTLKALETELMNRVAKTEDQDETDKWDNYLGLLDAPPEKNNEDQDRDNQGEQNNPPIVNYYEPLHHVARSIKPFESDFGNGGEQKHLDRGPPVPEKPSNNVGKDLRCIRESNSNQRVHPEENLGYEVLSKTNFDTFALEKILSQLIELNSTLESLDVTIWDDHPVPLLNEFENCIRNRLHITPEKRHDPSQSKPKVSEVRAISPVQATPMNNFVARVKKCFLCENEGHKAVYCRSTMSADDKRNESMEQAVNFISIDTDEKIDLFEGFIGKTKCEVFLDSDHNSRGFDTDLIRLVEDVTDVVLIHPEGETKISAYVSDRRTSCLDTVFGKINLELCVWVNEIIVEEQRKNLNNPGFIRHNLFTTRRCYLKIYLSWKIVNFLGMSLYCRTDEISANLKLWTKRYLIPVKRFTSIGCKNPRYMDLEYLSDMNVLIADSTPAIKIGFEKFLEQNIPKLIAVIAMNKNIQYKLQKISYSIVRQIKDDINLLQHSSNSKIFENASSCFVSKWKQQHAEVAEFITYFENNHIKQRVKTGTKGQLLVILRTTMDLMK
ncbi:hypothetical protein BLOT_016495 [Blomia tropicalis]|nr:hypothetical protein BLOT_016495 [Blomia tropicalis]